MSLGLANRGILAFADVDWSGTWYSRHQILSRLAHKCPVVIVGQPVPIRSVPTQMFARRALEPIEGQLWSYRAPAMLPSVYRPDWAHRLSLSLQARHLSATARKLGLDDPIAYVWNPDFAEQVESLDPRTVVYHCYDKYSAYQGANASEVDESEKRIVKRSELVIASSRILATDLEDRLGVPAVQLPHGVDFDYFDSLATQSPEPEDMSAIPRPRIGYVVRVDERFDTETLSAIARERPKWSIVIIGDKSFQSAESAASFDAFSKLPNVHILGGRPRQRIPAYTTALDVCLLCYRTDNWGRWVQPIKAYEYLACGRPVVSTRIDAAGDFGDLVRVADGLPDWIAQIEAGLEERGEFWSEKRRAFARANTWDKRVEELVRLLEARLSS